MKQILVHFSAVNRSLPNCVEAIRGWHKPENKVIVFSLGEEEKVTGSSANLELDFGLVETGEARCLCY